MKLCKGLIRNVILVLVLLVYLVPNVLSVFICNARNITMNFPTT